jgi:hypothetical protein
MDGAPGFLWLGCGTAAIRGGIRLFAVGLVGLIEWWD